MLAQSMKCQQPHDVSQPFYRMISLTSGCITYLRRHLYEEMDGRYAALRSSATRQMRDGVHFFAVFICPNIDSANEVTDLG